MNAHPFFHDALPKPRILTSACLAGQAVRYDGSDKNQPALHTRIASRADLVTLCPEMSLGIPRPPVQLVQDASGLRAVGVGDASLDVTATLEAFCEQQRAVLDTACGLILKARSPSCGIGNTPWYEAGKISGYRDGVFAGFVRQHYPWLPCMDEAGLLSIDRCDDFLYRACLVADAQLAWQENRLTDFQQHHASNPALDAALLARFQNTVYRYR